MQEKEFRKLLEKCIKGAETESERKVLEEFTEKSKAENAELYFQNEAHKIYLKESIWKGIGAQVNSQKPFWRIAASVAAIFTGLIVTSYLFLQIATTSNVDLRSENAITLELGDGSIKIIEENGVAKVQDKKGNIVGKQNKNLLIYNLKQFHLF